MGASPIACCSGRRAQQIPAIHEPLDCPHQPARQDAQPTRSLALPCRSGTTNYTVGVDLKTDGGRTRVVLTFPYHTTMYYDPTASFDSADGSSAGTITSTSSTSTTAATAAKNGAAGKHAGWGLLLGGAALLALV